MIHVVYTIYKSDGEAKPTYAVHDIIAHTDEAWHKNVLVTGGIREKLALTYPAPEYLIQVSHVTSAGVIVEQQ